MTPNMVVRYVDAATGELISEERYHDPFLAWVRRKDGSVALQRSYAGDPTPEWLAANPEPH